LKLVVNFRGVNKIFAKGFCFDKLFWLFMFASCIGAYYEEILNVVKTYVKTKKFTYLVRRGVFFGPFSPIYGIGAVIIVLILGRNKRCVFKTFVYAMLLGGFFEYLISYLQELFLKTTSWDYSNQFLNINGRTTIPIMIGWGILGAFLIHFVYPHFSNFIESFSYKPAKLITILACILMFLNIFISWSALIRQSLRKNKVEPFTFFGEFLDKHFPDSRVEAVFNNMKESNNK